MNKQRLAAIAEWLEGGAKHADVEFDMSVSLIPYDPENADHNKCGTTCCIAGAAVHFFDPKFEAAESPGEEVSWFRVKDRALKLLDLDYVTGRVLFEPSSTGSYDELADYNDPAWAARVVRNLIKTGSVDWDGMERAA